MNKLVVIKITKQEYETLVEIDNTSGAEILDYEGEFQSLVDKELVTVSEARGPGKRWRRVVITFKGIGVIYGAKYRTVIEG